MEQRKRKKKRVEVKLGHGGTLDPMATGVLIVGVGSGTKSLQGFLNCTKTYEATILFGVATDSYDTLGKVLNRAPYAHVTQERVEKALRLFRGKIMQRPPLFSALHVQGKRLYEYAREGKEVPVEIQERPVEVQDLSIVEWLEGGIHGYTWPSQDAKTEDKEVAEKVLHLEEVNGTSTESTNGKTPDGGTLDTLGKRKRSITEDDPLMFSSASSKKRQDTDEEIYMSGGLQGPDRHKASNQDADELEGSAQKYAKEDTTCSQENPPAVRLRMTVTSGFYVRSLAHDLGKAVDSLACMSDLVRSKQERFELGENVLNWSDIEGGEKVWAPKLEANLQHWQSRQPPKKQENADLPQDENRSLSQSSAG